MGSTKLEVGQKVFYEYIGGVHARRNGELTEATISKVAKKYFFVSELSQQRFYIDTLLADGGSYSASYRIVLSKQGFDDEKLHRTNLSKIASLIGLSHCSLEQSIKILEILEDK